MDTNTAETAGTPGAPGTQVTAAGTGDGDCGQGALVCARSGRTRRGQLVRWDCDRGATTAEYAITTLAACGFAALLVVILKSDAVRQLITKVISTALGMGQ